MDQQLFLISSQMSRSGEQLHCPRAGIQSSRPCLGLQLSSGWEENWKDKRKLQFYNVFIGLTSCFIGLEKILSPKGPRVTRTTCSGLLMALARGLTFHQLLSMRSWIMMLKKDLLAGDGNGYMAKLY